MPASVSQSRWWCPFGDVWRGSILDIVKVLCIGCCMVQAMSRRLLKFNGGSVDDYATLSTPTLSPSC